MAKKPGRPVKEQVKTPKKVKNAFIGIENESCLHRVLKYRYVGPGGKTEVTVGEFVADGINKGGEYIEVQTGSFGPLKKKVKEFAALGKVLIIHPIAVTKKIEVYEPDGSLLYRRKSPVHGSLWNIFDALLYAPELPLIRNVSIEIVLVDITEKRVRDGKGNRKGISKKDKSLTAWHESLLLKKPSDYLRFVPFKKNEEFTASQLAESAQVDKDTARMALYVLTKMKVVKRIGKKKTAWLYTR